MNPEERASRPFWLTIITFTFVAGLYAAQWTYSRSLVAGIILQRSVWGGMLLVYLVTSLICIWLFMEIWRFGKLRFTLPRFQFEQSFWRFAGLILFVAVLFLIPHIKFSYQIGQTVKKPVYDPIMLLILYYWMCWWALLLAMTALKVAFRTSWQAGFASALVILGLAYEVFTRFSALVTTYPLSTGWSEGSRFYYASLYFSRTIYGESLPLSTLHPTRYLLQSIPFLIPSLGLPFHRVWQFLLWIVLTAGAAIALSRRAILPSEKVFRWLLAGWYFLFLLRVGVYYHLEVMVILPLVFVSTKHPWRSLIAVIAASLWAGISRVNWFPVPAMIAIAIYLLETPLSLAPVSFRRLTQYLAQPALWMIAGLAAALVAQAAYIPLSGNANNIEAFGSSFSSALLWYRLWPNESYSLGVVPGILIVSAPLLVILIISVIRQWKEIHPVRWLGLFSMILALFAGSLVVSTKIGGGGDLHNMDAYATLLGIIAVFFIGGRLQTEDHRNGEEVRPWPVFTYALVMPLLFLIPFLSPYHKFNEGASQAAYNQLVETVNNLGKNGPVLFINERQLVAFGDVNVPLVPEDEVVTLMEMAMSGNQPYLDKFYSDLANHRFAAIVATKQNKGIKETGALVEENNVWNSRVSPYILCYYGPALRVDAEISNIEVYVPETDITDCP